MDALKYLKLDLRIIKEKNQYMLLVLSPILIPIIKYNIEVGITFLLVFILLYAIMPFSNENADKLEKIYAVFPSKSSSMVLGRFMYLTIIIIIMTVIYMGIGVYSCSVNPNEIIGYLEIGILFTVSVVSCYCSYPIYYKAQMEKENMVMTGVISLVILMGFSMVLLIPMISRWIVALYNEKFKFITSFIINYSKSLIFLDILIIIIAGYISYLISCKICKRKEV
ncbi:ABC-2 transporter permease [Clostridium sp.]|uniref:ABC-2 transporter permease n=1 Tax=Clostridium sp. TaxID=1506 RepID=UPI00260ECBD6|nr:ABC-2 transporter permease [Clostridium sp.]